MGSGFDLFDFFFLGTGVLLRDSREYEVSYGVAMFEFSAVQEILDGTEPVFAGGDGFHEDSMAEGHEASWIRVAMQDPGV
jgi:hypothetical protein